MKDFFDQLAEDAKETIKGGYYRNVKTARLQQASLKAAIERSKGNAVITEIKAASPSLGTIRGSINAKEIAETMERGGAVGISVLTEPKHFNGSLASLAQAREAVKLPLLMKDIILSTEQIEAGAVMGANAVLLIGALYERGYGMLPIGKMIEYAHTRGLEVLLETHTAAEFEAAQATSADLIGVNNRDLRTLQIDLHTTREILSKHKSHDRLVVSESGIQTQADLKFLRDAGASAFLIGSSIMLTENIEQKIREFVRA